jgi:opacity protein-like surface antigen
VKKLALAAALFALCATAASAADLAPYTKAPVAAPIYSWTGFYVGLNAGGAWNESNATTTTVFSPVGYFAASSVPAIATAGNQNINRSGFTDDRLQLAGQQLVGRPRGGLQLFRHKRLDECYRPLSMLRADRLHR